MKRMLSIVVVSVLTAAWSVNNDSVASVNQSGELTAHKGGVVTVTAYTRNEISDSIEIEISNDINGAVAGIAVGAGVIGVFIVYIKKFLR